MQWQRALTKRCEPCPQMERAINGIGRDLRDRVRRPAERGTGKQAEDQGTIQAKLCRVGVLAHRMALEAWSQSVGEYAHPTCRFSLHFLLGALRYRV